MEWDALIPLIIFLAAFALPMLLSRLRKTSQSKLDELYQHLRDIGVKASIPVVESSGEKEDKKRSWGEKVEGVIDIEDRNFDYINVISVSSQYGPTYYIEYIVKSRSQTGLETDRKTNMVRKKSPPLWWKVVDIEWRGEPGLAQRLNLDYQLKYRLLYSSTTGFKGGISIRPEPKYWYTSIRTDYQLPSPELFEAIDEIAQHIVKGA
jgi:hypothetical protein